MATIPVGEEFNPFAAPRAALSLGKPGTGGPGVVNALNHAALAAAALPSHAVQPKEGIGAGGGPGGGLGPHPLATPNPNFNTGTSR